MSRFAPIFRPIFGPVTGKITDALTWRGGDPLPPAYTPPTVTGGVEYDVLRDDGRMWRVHEFTTSGVLSVTDLGDNPMVRVVMVGGGASSGATSSPDAVPGGGAGGSVFDVVTELTLDDLDIIIGAGGPSVSGSSNGMAGSPTLLANGGGYGGGYSQNGGSMFLGNGGGAGSPDDPFDGIAPGRSGGEGVNKGGDSADITHSSERSSGGGAGAGGAGGDSVLSVGGDAGPGVQSDISGELEWYGAGAPGMAVSGTHGAPAPGGVTAPEIGAAGDPGTDGRGNAGAPAMNNASGRGGDGIAYFSYPLEALP